MKTQKFSFCNDTYTVQHDGSVWISPSNGQQHSTVGQAVRAELRATIEASGDDVDDHSDAISAIVNGILCD